MIKVTVLTSLYKGVKYLQGYFDAVRKLDNKDDIEILLLHNAPEADELQIIQENIKTLPFVKHVIIPEREKLYSTWNRGIRMAKGDYVCVWNIDDIRTHDSLLLEAAVLDADPEIDLTYGDFYYMFKYSEISDQFVKNKDFHNDPGSFFCSHQIGCFPMWRKSIHQRVGYFDDQFSLVADFDFQIRVARTGRIKKTNGLLGAYLEYVPEKLSSNFGRQWRECNALYLRYAIFDLLNWCSIFYVGKAFRIFHISTEGAKWVSVSSLFKDYRSFYIKRIPRLFISVIHQPRYFLAYIKHIVLNK